MQAKSLTVEQSFQAHTALSALWLDVLEQVRDESTLSLDPELNSYFLHLAALVTLPNLTEALGQTRAKGAGLLAQGQVTDVDRAAIIALISQIRDHYQRAIRSLEKASEFQATLQDRIASPVRDFNSKVQQAFRLVEEQILHASELTFAAADYYAHYTATIDAAFDLATLTTEELRTALQARQTAGLIGGGA